MQLTIINRSEAISGANPVGANSPQVPPYGLGTERISGTSFTAPRAANLQTWLYRVHPSLHHSEYSPLRVTAEYGKSDVRQTPNALR
jgi:homogentisate 1,2-dioxygenase